MRGMRVVGIVLWVVLGAAAPGGAAEQEVAAALEADLQRLGYENLAVRTTDSSLVVWCENRRIRYPVVWMIEAMALAAERVAPEMRVRVVAQRLARPVTTLSARAGDVRQWIDGRMPTSAFRRRLRIRFAGSDYAANRSNPSLRRFDLTLGPGRLLSQFGVPGDWIRAQFDVAADLKAALVPGLVGYGRLFIPLFNKGQAIGGDVRYNELRPGSVLTSYLQAFGATTFATVTGGMYELGNRSYDSYGVVVDVVHYSDDGTWAIGGSVGYLSYIAYTVNDEPQARARIWQIVWPPANRPYQALVSYRFSEFDLQLMGRWGRFLGGDRGWRVDVARRIGEIGVTIFGIRSDARFRGRDEIENRQDVRLLGGIGLEIPLHPRRRGMTSTFRVTSAESFAWNYRYRVGDVGVGVNTKHGVENLIAQYSPTVVGNNLDRAGEWVRSTDFVRERARHGVTASLGAERQPSLLVGEP